jgi:hypothetical protein
LEAQVNALTIFGISILMSSAPVALDVANNNLVFAQAGNCYSVGEQQAATQGGTLAAADDAVQNGQPVCRVIIVVPGQNGERPKRVEIIVPKA